MSEEITESQDSKSVELVEFEGKQMYPEVAQYFRVRRDAYRVKEDADSEAQYVWARAERRARRAWEEIPIDQRRPRDYFDSHSWMRDDTTLRDAWNAYTVANRAATDAYVTAHTEARQALKDSPHSEVRWIEANALDDEEGYSHAVLKALPVEDPAELWEVKRQHGMCGEFDRLYAQAEMDGAFNGGKKVPGAREMTALRNRLTRDYGARYGTDLIQALIPYQKAVKEHYEALMAEAKAEWQKLDEARAENATFNRSAGQRARYERERLERASADAVKALVEDDTSELSDDGAERLTVAQVVFGVSA